MVFSSVFEMLGFPSISQLLLAASLTLQLRSLKEYLRKSECWQSKLQKLKSLIVGWFFHIKKTHRIHVWYIYYIHLVDIYGKSLGKYTILWSGIVLSGPTFFYIIYLSTSSDMLATWGHLVPASVKRHTWRSGPWVMGRPWEFKHSMCTYSKDQFGIIHVPKWICILYIYGIYIYIWDMYIIMSLMYLFSIGQWSMMKYYEILIDNHSGMMKEIWHNQVAIWLYCIEQAWSIPSLSLSLCRFRYSISTIYKKVYWKRWIYIWLFHQSRRDEGPACQYFI